MIFKIAAISLKTDYGYQHAKGYQHDFHYLCF